MCALSNKRVVVAGGGVIGCATAYQLARSGMKVTLLERDAIAAHASGRNAGNINPLYGTPAALLPFAVRSFHIHAEVRAELTQLGCARFVAQPVKRLHIGYAEADREELKQVARLFNAHEGFSATWLEGSDVRELEPRLASDINVGVVTEGSLSIDSHEFTLSLADGAARLGAVILRSAATGVVTSGETVTAIKTGRGTVSCDEVVFATGPWVADTQSWLNIDLAVEPVKGQLLLMRMAEDVLSCDITWGQTAFYRRRENEVWIGGTMEKCGFDDKPTGVVRESLLDRAAQILPDIKKATLLDHIAALRPMAASKAPIAGRAKGWQNVYVANGGGMKGVLLAVGIARRICDLLGDGESDLPGEDVVS